MTNSLYVFDAKYVAIKIMDASAGFDVSTIDTDIDKISVTAMHVMIILDKVTPPMTSQRTLYEGKKAIHASTAKIISATPEETPEKNIVAAQINMYKCSILDIFIYESSCEKS